MKNLQNLNQIKKMLLLAFTDNAIKIDDHESA